MLNIILLKLFWLLYALHGSIYMAMDSPCHYVPEGIRWKSESQLSSSEPGRPKGNAHELIAEGDKAVEGCFPWMVAIYRQGEYICSATLIGDRLVLTARHCIIGKDGHVQKPEHIVGHVGSVNRSSPILQIHFSKFYASDMQANSSLFGRDIAVLATTEKISFNAKLNRMCLANESIKIKSRKALAVGWGRLGSPRIPNILRYTWVEMVSAERCFSDDKKPKPSIICVDPHPQLICEGDSGGPLIALNQLGDPIQIGILSTTGESSACPELVQYTPVSNYFKTIAGIAKKYNSTLCSESG